MNDQPHSPDEPQPDRRPETPVDAGSQALAEALRSSFAIVRFVMIVLVLVFLASGFFQVGPQERGIILRFGKPVGEGEKALLAPGLHFGFPPPIDEVKKVSITGIQKVESTVGWYFMTPEQEAVWRATGAEPPAGATLNPAADGYVLTADANIIHVRAALFYHIDNPIRYVFGFTEASNLVQNALNNALFYAAAHFTVDDILTRDQFGFQEAVRHRATELLDAQKVGIVVERCDVYSEAPRQQVVRKAFLDVNNAEIARNTKVQDALSYQNTVLSRAGAEAVSLTNAAETARIQLISQLASDATNFSGLLPRYRSNPNLFVQQRLMETLGRSLTNAEKWLQPAPAGGKTIVNWILLNREIPASAVQTNQ